jgi:hypothetical protein
VPKEQLGDVSRETSALALLALLALLAALNREARPLELSRGDALSA